MTKILLWSEFSFYNVHIYLCMGMCLQMCAITVTTERYFYNYAVKEENVSQLLVILVVCIVTWKYAKMSWLYLKKNQSRRIYNHFFLEKLYSKKDYMCVFCLFLPSRRTPCAVKQSDFLWVLTDYPYYHRFTRSEEILMWSNL